MRCSCGQENPASAAQCLRCGRALGGGENRARWLRDAAAALALLLALGVVFLVDWLRAGPVTGPISGSSAEPPVAGEPPQPVMAPLRLAVTPPVYDDVGKLLDTLGSGYRYTTIECDDLLDGEKLRPYHVVFLTCGGVPRAWLDRRLRDGERDGGGVFTARAEIVKRLRASLRGFVARGGTLYASDWQFDLLAIAFPEFVDRAKVGEGAVQTVTADVVDSGLQRLLGPTIELRFDKAAWRPAALKGKDVTTYLQGQYRTQAGNTLTAPLLVQFPFEDGHVIFTSFHNEVQNTETELKLLRHLVFAAVTAQLESSVVQTMVRGGFSPVDRNLLSASAKDQSVEQTYECRGERSLQFVLGFEARGAELRLTVVGPDGTRLEKTGTSTLSIDVSRAAAGVWKYTVTPIKVPYQNFPFTLTVGEK